VKSIEPLKNISKMSYPENSPSHVFENGIEKLKRAKIAITTVIIAYGEVVELEY
jgi:hypothetical protein